MPNKFIAAQLRTRGWRTLEKPARAGAEGVTRPSCIGCESLRPKDRAFIVNILPHGSMGIRSFYCAPSARQFFFPLDKTA